MSEQPSSRSLAIAIDSEPPEDEPPPSQVQIAEQDGPANDTDPTDGPVAARAEGSADTPEPPIDRTLLFARLSQPRLRRRLLAYLIKNKELIPHRAEDVVQMTYLRALRARRWPEKEGRMFAWMKAIADNSFVDDLRKRERREEVEELHDDVDVVGEPPDDEHARHVANVARELAAKSAHNAATLEMLTAEAEEEPVSVITADWSISKESYYQRKSRFVAAVKKRLVEIASLSTGTLGLFLMLHVLTFVTLFTVMATPPVPGPSDPLPTLRAHEGAGTVRRRGLGACRDHEYERCLELLNRARKLDPAGDTDPSVVSARDAAEAALRDSVTPQQR